MSLCQKIRHCLPVLGLASLTLVYFTPAKAAPLCAQVLMRSLSEEEISATVTSLATMRLNLDLAQIEGRGALEVRFLEQQYPVKLADLNSKLSRYFTEKEIHELLVNEIAKQQGRKNDESVREKAVRKAERSALTPEYKLTKTVLLPSDLYQWRFEFIPENDVVLYQSQNKEVVRKNMTTGEELVLAHEIEAWTLLQDRQTILITQQNGQISKVEILSGKSRDVTKVDQNCKAKFDCSGETMVTEIESVQWIHENFTSGRKTNIPYEQRYYPTPLSKDKIFFWSYDGSYVYNINTKKKVQLKQRWENSRLRNFAPLEDGQSFALYSDDGQFEFYNVKNPAKPFFAINEPIPDHHFISEVQKISDRPFFIARDLKSEAYYSIFSLSDPQQPLFTFPIYGSFGDSSAKLIFKFSQDGYSTATLVRGLEGFELHIWQQKEY